MKIKMQALSMCRRSCVLAALMLLMMMMMMMQNLHPSDALQVQSSSSSSSTSTLTSTIRLRGNRLRRPDVCKDNLPRKAEDLPALVATGLVREVYMAPSEQQASQLDQVTGNNVNRALVLVGRVIKGNQQLVGSDIVVSGFNSTSSTPCPNYVKPNDTLIMLLEHEGDRKYSIQGSNLLSLNLNNLDRINALAAGEPQRRRPLIEDILCEARYCPYGRCVVLNEKTGETACKCPDSCPLLEQAPVCGSDNSTYSSECHLIREGCKRQRPLFVTKESSC